MTNGPKAPETDFYSEIDELEAAMERSYRPPGPTYLSLATRNPTIVFAPAWPAATRSPDEPAPA